MSGKRVSRIATWIFAGLLVACGGGGGGGGGRGASGGTPTNPVVSISAATASKGDNGVTFIIFTITLNVVSSSDITVDFTTSDAGGSAVAGLDYTQTSGTVTIPAGDTSATVSVPVSADTVVELDEVFVINLSNISSNASAFGTIVNDDIPVISISSGTVDEGDSGSNSMIFQVNLDAPSIDDVTVDFITSDGTATAASGDYSPVSDTLTIPAGDISASIAVLVSGDLDIEVNETFSVTLSNLTGTAAMGNATATGTITNDDVASGSSRVSVSGTFVVEGDAGNDVDLVFTVEVDPPSATVTRISYATVDINATAPDDYTSASGQVTVPANTSSQDFAVTVIGDDVVEDLEAFRVSLSRTFGSATLVSPTALGYIVDNDGSVAPGLTVANASVNEGDSGTLDMSFTAVLNQPLAQDVTVEYVTEDDSAIAGSDYTAVSGVLTIPAGDLMGTITVPVSGDTVIEADEAFFLRLRNISGGASLLTATAAGVIFSDDPLAQISASDVGTAEGDSGTTSLIFTVEIDSAAADPVTLDYQTGDGADTATVGSDYTAASGSLVIPAGSTSATITVELLGDTAPENDEFFTLTLSNASSNAQIADSDVRGTVVNDDGDPG